MQRIGVIGSGFAGLAAAAVLAKAGREVHVYEKMKCRWQGPRLSCCRLHFRYGSFLVLDAEVFEDFTNTSAILLLIL